MTTIQDLPLDTWVIIMLNVRGEDLINSFNKLIHCQAIYIPLQERLNTFWIVAAQARTYNNMKESIEMFTDACDATVFKNMYNVLNQMGFGPDVTMDAIRSSNGKIETALCYLGILTS